MPNRFETSLKFRPAHFRSTSAPSKVESLDKLAVCHRSVLDPSNLELYTESVFFGRYRSVFLGIYHTDTEGKLGWYFWYQKIGGSPSKNWREPPFS